MGFMPDLAAVALEPLCEAGGGAGQVFRWSADDPLLGGDHLLH